MLSNFKNGCVDVTIGEKKMCTASYIQDVPLYLLRAFIEYLSPENVMPFGFVFDCEDKTMQITEITNELVVFDPIDMDPKKFVYICYEDLGLPKMVSARNLVKHLAKETIKDVEENFEDCINWELDYNATKSDRWIRKVELQHAIQKLSYLVR